MFLFLLFTWLFFPLRASAHAFGQTYILPVPAWLFIYGGAAAVLISFLVIGYFIRPQRIGEGSGRRDITQAWFVRFWHRKRWVQLLSLALFIFTVVSGLFGDPDPVLNFAPTFFWVIFLLGMTYLSALVGNFWEEISPFKIIIKWLQKASPQLWEGKISYPNWLGYYPALLFYIILIVQELFSGGNAHSLAFLMVEYTLMTLVGAYLFGSKAWLRYGEFFAVYFHLLSKCAPLDITEEKVALRSPLSGLRATKPKHVSLLLFVIFMLSSTAFDGFRSTTSWISLIANSEHIYLLGGHNFFDTYQIVLLLAGLAIFFVLYLIFITGMKEVTNSSDSVRELALTFAYSLIPITLVYNIAHYYMLLLTQGQAIISLVSDPLGRGWDIFHTVNYAINPALIRASTVWYSQVALIVIGHIASVYVAHLIALKKFPTPRLALFSQLPMLILMICYTITGLWILSQPLTLGG